MTACLDREPHPLPRAKAMTCFSDHVYYSVPALHSLFFLHRDSVRTACARSYKYTLLPPHRDGPRGIFPSSLIVYVGSFFDTAFWPFSACGQGFRQGSLRTLLRVICFMGQDRRPINNACAASRRGLLQPSLLASADRSSPIWIICMISEML